MSRRVRVEDPRFEWPNSWLLTPTRIEDAKVLVLTWESIPHARDGITTQQLIELATLPEGGQNTLSQTVVRDCLRNLAPSMTPKAVGNVLGAISYVLIDNMYIAREGRKRGYIIWRIKRVSEAEIDSLAAPEYTG